MPNTTDITRSKAFIVSGVVATIIIVLVLIFGWGYISGMNIPFLLSIESSETDGGEVVVSVDTSITIPSGASASEVAALLFEAGVVPSGDAFLTYARELGVSSQLQAGTYYFSGGMTLKEVVQAVATGNLGVDALTIPEGYTLSSIASAVEEITDGRITADEFINASSDASVYSTDYYFLEDAPDGVSLEGFLFPLMYSITPDDTADSIIRKMLDQFEMQISSLDWSYPESQGLSIYDAVTLASIVEKESTGDEEIRARVAAVFYNRLSDDNTETNGYLQSDATTAYEVGHDPTADEVKTGEYSTYANAGLPPTPICSPSIESLEAVCNPAVNYSDYYYFIFWTNDNGEVEYAFSKIYAEHLAAIAEYL